MGKQRAQIPSRFDRVKKTLDHYLPDTYTIRKKETSDFDSLGFPTITEVALEYTLTDGTVVTSIPCRLQENRTLREGFKDLGQDNTLDYQELVTYSDAPILVNHKITINNLDYEVITVNPPSTYSPYKSAFIVHVGEPT